MESTQHSASPASKPKITDVEHVASYNWFSASEPTIMVPGMPAKWSVKRDGTIVPPDTESEHRDNYYARFAKSPMEPLIQSVLTLRPDYDFSSMDIITDRSPMALLLGYVLRGKSRPSHLKEFALGIRVIKNTAVLFRLEDKAQLAASQSQLSFWRNFEKAALTYRTGIEAASQGHHRITQYRFGDLKILMRNAVHGYDQNRLTMFDIRDIRKNEAGESTNVVVNRDEVDATKPSSRAKAETLATGLRVIRGGFAIDPSALLELSVRNRETQSSRGIEKRIPNLWLGQTPLLAKCVHRVNQCDDTENVIFDDIEMVRTVDLGLLEKFERENTNELQELIQVLHNILQVAKKFGGPIVVSYGGMGTQLKMSPSAEAGKIVPKLPQGLHIVT